MVIALLSALFASFLFRLGLPAIGRRDDEFLSRRRARGNGHVHAIKL